MPKYLHPTLHRALGWTRPLPQPKKNIFSVTFAGDLPPKVDLRSLMPPVYDQGALGSCTANAFAGLAEFLMKQQGLPEYVPSRLFIYYNERALEGTTNDDAGASLTDGANVMKTLGVPRESKWWYNIAKFKVKPSKSVFTEAAKHLLTGVAPVAQDLNEFRKALASSHVFVGGFSVFESFESNTVSQTGNVPMPGPNEQILGGHAIAVVGYDDSINSFIVRNSWGAGWGAQGYFYMPYAYLTDIDLADDFWVATGIS